MSWRMVRRRCRAARHATIKVMLPSKLLAHDEKICGIDGAEIKAVSL
jgi:hypothetical protein